MSIAPIRSPLRTVVDEECPPQDIAPLPASLQDRVQSIIGATPTKNAIREYVQKNLALVTIKAMKEKEALYITLFDIWYATPSF